MKCSDCYRKIKPVVGLDLDGTLADYHGHLFDFAEQYLDTDYDGREYEGGEKLADFMGLTDDVYRQMKLAFRQGGMKRTMPAFPEAQQLAAGLRTMGAEVWIVTTRPYQRFDSTDPDTREWLRRHDIGYDGLIYDDDKYQRLLDCVGPDRIVGVLEDLPEQYDRAAELGLQPFQMETSYNRAVRRTVTVGSLRSAAVYLGKRVREWRDEYD